MTPSKFKAEEGADGRKEISPPPSSIDRSIGEVRTEGPRANIRPYNGSHFVSSSKEIVHILVVLFFLIGCEDGY